MKNFRQNKIFFTIFLENEASHMVWTMVANLAHCPPDLADFNPD